MASVIILSNSSNDFTFKAFSASGRLIIIVRMLLAIVVLMFSINYFKCLLLKSGCEFIYEIGCRCSCKRDIIFDVIEAMIVNVLERLQSFFLNHKLVANPNLFAHWHRL